MVPLKPRSAAFAPNRRRLLATALQAAGLVALSGCAGPALARPPALATLEVYDRDNGQVLPHYHHEGRQYVPGHPGARYALRLRNLTGGRVLVVLSVDGINVVSGETADWQQVGYVLDPYRSYDINGWRKSGTEVAAFEFAPIQRSYAALTGRPGHVGVIGMAVFRERLLPPPSPPVSPGVAPPLVGRASPRDSGPAAEAAQPAPAPAPRAAAPGAEEGKAATQSADADRSMAGSRLGTGHGQREWSVSHRTHFERASRTPAQLTELAYDSHERLAAAGIIPSSPYAYNPPPRPFPGNAPGYVPDPPRR